MDVIRKIAKKLYAHEPRLYPEDVWDDTLEMRIDRLSLDKDTLSEEQYSYAQCVKAGLFLWNESLQSSHQYSQDVTNATGSYWHGLMHRMEGDYSNAKYWFYQSGKHPIFPQLIRKVKEILIEKSAMNGIANHRLEELLGKILASEQWSPDLLIDAIQLQVTSAQDEAAERLLLRIQRTELEALLQYSYSESFGGNVFDDI